MRFTHRWLAVAALGATLASCATSTQLARRSEREERAGQLEAAWATARAAVDRKAGNPEARAAAVRTGQALLADREHQVLATAAGGDTLTAGDQVLALAKLRLELERYSVPIPPDAAFAAAEASIRRNAAAQNYDLGRQSQKADRPKEAYRRYVVARDLVPRFRDLDTRLPKVYERAITPVAILPFNETAGLDGLAQPIADRTYSEVAKRLDPDAFTFTRLVPQGTVYGRVSVSELGQIDRDRAIALGRALGARRVVWARLTNLRTDTDSEIWHESLWRSEDAKDDSGRAITRWEEHPFTAFARQRHVTVTCEFDVLDTDSEESLLHRSFERDMAARAVWTEFHPDGNASAYQLCPGDAGDDRIKQANERWHSMFGGWGVPQLLECTRQGRARGPSRDELRQAFASDPSHGQMFLADPPPAGDLAAVALDDVWKPVLSALAELDPR